MSVKSACRTDDLESLLTSHGHPCKSLSTEKHKIFWARSGERAIRLIRIRRYAVLPLGWWFLLSAEPDTPEAPSVCFGTGREHKLHRVDLRSPASACGKGEGGTSSDAAGDRSGEEEGSLERDPLLADRLKRLRTIPGVGPITALTWALEIGDVSRFQSVKQAISYCGLCSAERSSADKLIRMPISKQRNKHIQQTLVEAAKLAPRYSHELALVYERERQRGNKNRATLAVARKMVAYMLAVERRKQNFVLKGECSGTAAA
jgi:hypothetical protein